MTLAEDVAHLERLLAERSAERSALADALIQRMNQNTRLARERDAALTALKQASEDIRTRSKPLWMVASAVERTIQAIETGAIHNDQP